VEPAVGVDSRVDEQLAEPTLGDAAGASLAPEHLVAATGWDDRLLLHVDVHQLARTSGLDAADHPPADPVHPDQAVDPVAHEHPMHGGGRHVEDRGDAGGPELATTTQSQDPLLDLSPSAVGTARRATGAVRQSSLTFGQIAIPPLRRGLARDVHCLGGGADRPTGIDPKAQPESTLGGHWSVTVHSSLLGAGVAGRRATPSPGGSLHRWTRLVNNVDGHYT